LFSRKIKIRKAEGIHVSINYLYICFPLLTSSKYKINKIIQETIGNFINYIKPQNTNNVKNSIAHSDNVLYIKDY